MFKQKRGKGVAALTESEEFVEDEIEDIDPDSESTSPPSPSRTTSPQQSRQDKYKALQTNISSQISSEVPPTHLKSFLPRRSSVIRLIRNTPSSVELEHTKALMTTWRARHLPTKGFAKEWVDRCIALRETKEAVQVIADRKKYGLDIDGQVIKKLLNHLSRKLVEDTEKKEGKEIVDMAFRTLGLESLHSLSPDPRNQLVVLGLAASIGETDSLRVRAVKAQVDGRVVDASVDWAARGAKERERLKYRLDDVVQAWKGKDGGVEMYEEVKARMEVPKEVRKEVQKEEVLQV